MLFTFARPRPVFAVILMLALCGCATTELSPYPTGDSSLAGRIKACRSGDTEVASADQCLQDDAACYQMANSKWCTGPRGNECPAGSSELPADSRCPTGTRCFQLSESKTCAIQFK